MLLASIFVYEGCTRPGPGGLAYFHSEHFGTVEQSCYHTINTNRVRGDSEGRLGVV